MKHNELPISLSEIKCDVYADTRAAGGFDGRHHFAVGAGRHTLAVQAVITNERCRRHASAPGVRRRLTVSLSDATDGRMVGSADVRLNIPSGESITTLCACIPFDGTDIEPTHLHSVEVRDTATGHFLGDYLIRMFDERLCDRCLSDWYCVADAGVAPQYSWTLYKSLMADNLAYHIVRFNIRHSPVGAPGELPELEVRLHWPGERVQNGFCRMYHENNEYRVEMPFLMTPGKRGVCYAELLCLDIALAGFVFRTDGPTVLGPWYSPDLACLDEYSPDAAARRYQAATAADTEDATGDAVEDAAENAAEDAAEDSAGESSDGGMAAPQQEPAVEDTPALLPALDWLTGLGSVKAKLSAYEMLARFNTMRREAGLPTPSLPLHAMFIGSPGTGKTTVARMMGVMLRRAGVLSRGHIVVRERATLLGPHYSEEETNTLKAIDEAAGGILFIDEAYQLCQPDDPRDPGHLVIETLMTALADESRRDWMLVLAGYPDEMRRLFDLNPGLRSRIPESNVYVFDDFTVAELMEIAGRYLKRNGYHLTPGAHEALSRRLAADHTGHDRTFGNARHVLNLIQTEIIPAMARRVVAAGRPTERALSEIQAADIPVPVQAATRRAGIGFRA